MALGNLTISAVKIDNEPTVRSLSAQINTTSSPVGNEIVKWSFDDTTIQAQTKFGIPYTTDTLGAYNTLSSMVFKITTDTYNYKIQKNILDSGPYEKTLSAVSFTEAVDLPENIISSAAYTLNYDLFPAIPSPKLYINYENTDHSSLFYRVTSGNYRANLSAIFDPSFLNLTNLLSGSENFQSNLISPWRDTTPGSFSRIQTVFQTAPDSQNTGTLFSAVRLSPFNAVNTFTNILTAGLPDYFLQIDKTYVVPQSGYITTGSGTSAIFTITVSNSSVTTLSALTGGQDFSPGDTITINRDALGIIEPDPTIVFDVESVLNRDHYRTRFIGPLSAQTYTYSVFAYPSGDNNTYLYFDGFGKGTVVFDIDNNVAYNNGTWDSVSVDSVEAFNIKNKTPIFNVQVNGVIRTIVLSGDRFFIGGDFTTCNDKFCSYACTLCAENGAVLTSGLAISGFNAPVNTIAVSGNRIYAGGAFTTYRGSTYFGNGKYIVRVGGGDPFAIDADFAPASTIGGEVVNGEVVLIKPNTARNILFVGGAFDTYNSTSTGRNGIVVLNPNGTEVSTSVFEIRDKTSSGLKYNTNSGVGVGGEVRAVEFLGNGTGNILIGGGFNSWRGYGKTNNIVLTDSKGEIVDDFKFDPGFDSTVNTIQINSANTKFYVGGEFTTYKAKVGTSVKTYTSPGFIRIAYGGNATIYPTEAGTKIYTSLLNSTETALYLGGSFLTFNGSPYYRLFRLDTTTEALDTTFNTTLGFNNTVRAIALSSGSTKANDVIFTGGDFTSYKSETISPYIVSLNGQGILRTGFTESVGARGWKRCCATFTLSAPQSDNFRLGLTTQTDSASSPATQANRFAVWGAQLNYQQTGTRTPYISTSDVPVTRYYNTAYIYFNNNPTPTLYIPLVTSNVYTALTTFDVYKTPLISSCQVVVSAASTFDSYEGYQDTKWFTPHLFTNSISAAFVTRFLTADFVAFPKYYFQNSGTKSTAFLANDSNYTLTPGPCFYGEGHTETINLSALSGVGAQYFWTIGSDDLGYYEVSSVIDTGYYNVNIPTVIYSYPKIPIQLVVSDGTILSSGPFYYYSDTTGLLSAYPFYYNTEEFESRNTKYRNGIQIVSYIPPASSFDSGFTTCPDFLPTDDSPKDYTAFLKFSLSGYGEDTLDPCYGLSALIWRWTTFKNLSAPITIPPFGTIPSFTDITTTLTGKPSSWYTTQCLATAITEPPYGITQNTQTSALSGPYPKKWLFEPLAGTIPGFKAPNIAYGSPLVWALSTPEWSVLTQISADGTGKTNYYYDLQYLHDGDLPYTTSIYKNTPAYVQGNQTVYTLICAEPYDWQVKNYLYSGDKNCLILSRGDFRIYTSNKYVLTGVQVVFQNISQGFNDVANITIDLDDGKSVILDSSSIYSDITASYTEIGYKTIVSTVNYTDPSTKLPVTSTFSNIIKVVGSYDAVDPDNYLTPLTPIQLPWSEVPYIASNEWVNDDNINSVFAKFYDNLEYLNTRGRSYKNEPTEFYGWLGAPPIIDGCPIYTWDSLNCLDANNTDSVTWEDLQIVDSDFPTITTTGRLSSCCSWDKYICNTQEQNPNKIGKYCTSWKWSARTFSNSKVPITWANTKNNRVYNKKWVFEPCETRDGLLLVGAACDEGVWNVNINKINTYYDPILNCRDSASCVYRDIVSKDNLLYTALATEIKVLSSDYSATFVASRLLLDDLFAFRDIRGIALDSQNKLFVLDGILNKVASYTINLNDPVPFDLFLTWGGFGTSKSVTGFSKPNDICVDLTDNVWVADTGNKCIKGYSNTGTWLITIIDDNLRASPPISVTVDSENNLHCLTLTDVKVYDQRGTFITDYTFTNIESNSTPLKINTNYNKEIIYIVFGNKVLKYFKNGNFAGYLINNKSCATNINDVFQDEFRNTLVVSGDKILKYVDLMEQTNIKGTLPNSYWPLSSLYIHKDEYVQNWVYNKSFQRLWDNIEMFRHSLIFDESNCKKYIPPVYSKDKIIIGQNEIVTSSVVNRSIQYLWENFQTLFNYFDPDCS